MALVFGIGVGLFILIVLWAVAIVTGLVTMQWSNGGPITAGAVLLASIITIILVLIPRGNSIFCNTYVIRGSSILLLS